MRIPTMNSGRLPFVLRSGPAERTAFDSPASRRIRRCGDLCSGDQNWSRRCPWTPARCHPFRQRAYVRQRRRTSRPDAQCPTLRQLLVSPDGPVPESATRSNRKPIVLPPPGTTAKVRELNHACCALLMHSSVIVVSTARSRRYRQADSRTPVDCPQLQPPTLPSW